MVGSSHHKELHFSQEIATCMLCCSAEHTVYVLPIQAYMCDKSGGARKSPVSTAPCMSACSLPPLLLA
jgi:hypothetical protein